VIFYLPYTIASYIDKRPVATGANWFFTSFLYFFQHQDWQPKTLRTGATAINGSVASGCVQSSFGHFFSCINQTFKHYTGLDNNSWKL